MLEFTLTHPRRKEGVVLRSLGDETILYDPECKKVHVLNVTSLLIWNLCTGDHTLADIEREVRSHFNVDEQSDARADMEDTLLKFRTEGLLLPEG